MSNRFILKSIVWLSLLLSLAIILSACGGGDIAATETESVSEGEEVSVEPTEAEEPEECVPVVLQYWDEFGAPEDAAIWDPIIEEFNETHECEINVEVRHIADEEFFTAIRTGVTGSNPPDVFMHESGLMLKELVEADAVMDISDWWDENKDRWQPGSNTSNTIDGIVYGVPFESLLRDLLAWNVDILEENNLEPPETWEDFLNACDVLSEAGVVPLAIGNQRGWPGGHLWQTIALRIAGAEKQNKVMNRDGVHWTDPDFILASQLYAEIAERDCLSPGFATDDFGAGQSFFLGGNSAFFHPFTLMMPSWPPKDELNWEWDRFPQFPNNRKPYADENDLFAANLYGFSISSQTDNPEEAMIFFEYLVSPEVQKQFVQNSRLTPMVDVLEQDKISEDLARWQEIQSEGAGAIGFVVLEVPAEVSRQVFDVGALSVWTGQMTPEEWMWEMEQAHAELTGTEALQNP